MDLTAVSGELKGDYIEYKTGLAFEIPRGHVGLIYPRSSISNKTMYLANAVGIIDSQFRGEVTFRFRLHPASGAFPFNRPKIYEAGDRVGQMSIMSYPYIKFNEVEKLSETERGEGGYGSTGD